MFRLYGQGQGSDLRGLGQVQGRPPDQVIDHLLYLLDYKRLDKVPNNKAFNQKGELSVCCFFVLYMYIYIYIFKLTC